MKVQGNLNLSGRNDLEICLDSKNYTTLITGSSNFKNPAVSNATAALFVEQVNNTILATTALSNAIAAPISATRLDTIKSTRAVLDANLTALVRLVEILANAATVLDINRLAILHSAGITERNVTIRQKQVFAAEIGDEDGSVKLFAKGIVRGSHELKYSADTSSVDNWQLVDSTLQASTEVKNLVRGQLYAFSHRTIEKDGPTSWENRIVCRAK